MKGEYYLGLDMGSSSVGWAVTNEKYEILRAHGKTLWGVRLFDSAQTAEERRGFRTAKRRLDRRNWRIELLQKIFAEEVEKIDDGFFRRMKESRYWPEDKRDRQGKCPELPYALFADDDYTDKEYHKQFPTIYHLRKWFMETDETPDIRLIYLALHHMMKHRGHFLLNGNIEQVREFQTTFEQFLEAVRAEELGFSSEIGVERSKEIEAILKDRTLTKSAKKTKAVKAMRAETSCEKEWLGLITGGTAKLGNLFGEKQMDTLERPNRFCQGNARRRTFFQVKKRSERDGSSISPAQGSFSISARLQVDRAILRGGVAQKRRALVEEAQHLLLAAADVELGLHDLIELLARHAERGVAREAV